MEIHKLLRGFFPLFLFFFLIFFDKLYAQKFSGEVAFKYLIAQTNLGYRYPTSIGHKKLRLYFNHFFKKRGINFEIDSFRVNLKNTIYKKDTVIWGYNYIIHFYHNNNKPLIFIGAHYDTRLKADKDYDMGCHVLGANDGASGVSIIMHLIDILDKSRLKYSIDFILFDLEDQGTYESDTTFCYGSQYYASKILYNKYLFGIILDMVGDKDLDIYYERNSYYSSREVLEKIYGISKSLNYNFISPKVVFSIYDDHIPFIEKGIPTIDLIDFNYPYWHTCYDIPENTSSESLEKVGRVIELFLYQGL